MIFESHAHYDDSRFDKDREEVLLGLKNNRVATVINVGDSIETSKKSIEMAEKYDFVYAAVGVHPHNASQMKDEDLETLLNLATHKKVVAIGEIGLDYYYENSPKEVQRLRFKEQLEIAKKAVLPVIIHSREATKETMDIIKEANLHETGGVIHCFSGSTEIALEYIKMGLYIGVGGIVTYENAKTIKEVVKAIPLEAILVETDCPYLAPVPNRGKRNDSTQLIHVINMISQIKGIDPEVVIKQTYDNGVKLFMDR